MKTDWAGIRPTLTVTLMRNVALTFAPEYRAEANQIVAILTNNMFREESGPDGTVVYYFHADFITAIDLAV